MEDIMKIVKSFGSSGLLITGVTQQSKMKQKNKEVDFILFKIFMLLLFIFIIYIIKYIRSKFIRK